MSNKPLVGDKEIDSRITNLSADQLTAAGDLISKSLIFSLGRNYLDGPIFEEDYLRFIAANLQETPNVAFFKLVQMGKPVSDDFTQQISAIETTLGAAHDPRYSLIFAISSDGLQSNIYFGAVAKKGGAHPKTFINQLGQFLCSNLPGTRIETIEDYEEIVKNIHLPISQFSHSRAFTGIPSPRLTQDSKRVNQGIDQLMRGLRGQPYLYLVIAEPLEEKNTTSIISACRTLAGQVHAFSKATINQSNSAGTSKSLSSSESESVSKSKSTAKSESESESKSKGVLGSVIEPAGALGVAGMAGMLAVAPVAPLFTGMLGIFGQIFPSTTKSTSVGKSTSESETLGKTLGKSETEGISSNESLSFGREYLNKHAEASEKMLDNMIVRFENARSQGCWNVGTYLLSNQEEAISQGQAQLRSLISGKTSNLEPIRDHDLRSIWEGRGQVALDTFNHPPMRLFVPGKDQQLNHPLGKEFEGLTTILNTEELALLANLPTRELPGVPVQPVAQFSLNPPKPPREDKDNWINIGRVLDGGEPVFGLEYEADLNSFSRHLFITGITGSGKSNTMRKIIQELVSREINFMVVEPAKDEYVQLAMKLNASKKTKKKIKVFMPGQAKWQNKKLEVLKLNPFDLMLIKGATPQVMTHMDRLKSIFNASFPMQEILPVILEEALVDLYESQGWLEDKLPPPEAERPRLENLYNRISGLVRDKGYEQRITDNIIAALRTRIGSLLRGWKGDLFNHGVSTPWEELFDQPVIINLQNMGDDADKSFTMALIMNFMYEYRRAQNEVSSGSDNTLFHHLAIFEEAHRLLRATGPSMTNEASPQAKMGEMFADMLAEIRAYGQGMAIIDQVPTKLVPDSLKNTNLKIIHRLVAKDDRDILAGNLALAPEQAEVIARLKVGQAIIGGIHDDMPAWVQVGFSPINK